MASTFRTVRFFDRVANDGSTLRVSRGFSSREPTLCFSLDMPLRHLSTVILNRVQVAELRIRIDEFLRNTISDQAVLPLWEDEEEVD